VLLLQFCVQVLSLAGQSSCCATTAAPGTDGLASIITSCTALTTLNLEGCTWVSREAVQAIVQAQQQHLSASSSTGALVEEGEKADGGHAGLTRLHLHCQSLDDSLAGELAAACPGLMHITLEGSSLLTTAGVAPFVQVRCSNADRCIHTFVSYRCCLPACSLS
jgi:hypothetical protein